MSITGWVATGLAGIGLADTIRRWRTEASRAAASGAEAKRLADSRFVEHGGTQTLEEILSSWPEAERASYLDRFERVLGLVEVRPTSTVLELGAWEGYMQRRLLEVGFAPERVIGVSLNHPALIVARNRGIGTTLVEADVQRLPVATASCDLVLGLDILGLVYDRSAAGAECARVTAAGGRVIHLVNNRHVGWCGRNPVAWIVALASLGWDRLTPPRREIYEGADGYHTVLHAFSRRELASALPGFRLVHLESAGFRTEYRLARLAARLGLPQNPWRRLGRRLVQVGGRLPGTRLLGPHLVAVFER